MKPFYPFFVYNCFLLNSAEVILVRCHFSHFEIFLMFPQVIIKNINEYTKEMSKSWSTAFLKHQKKERWGTKQEAHRQRFTHLSEIATADTGMQMLCNIFPILSLQLMKGSSFEQVMVLKKKNVFFYYHYFKIYGHDSQWSMTIRTNSQSRFNSRIDIKLGGNWPTDFWRQSVQQYHDFIHVYSIGGKEDKPHRIKC